MYIYKLLPKKCQYAEFSSPVFSRIWTKYVDLHSISPY